MLVHEIMNKQVISAEQSEPAGRAARLIAKYNIGAVPVLGAENKLRGIVTDRDIVLRCIVSGAGTATPLREIMSRCVITASPDDEINTAADKMKRAQIRRLPVTKNGELVGMLSLSDIAKHDPACAESILKSVSEGVHRLQKSY